MGSVRVHSFQKKIIKSKEIPGTKPSIQNAQLLTSSGIPSLDAVIGGGFPVGSLILIEEDLYGSFSNQLVKYYLSEGIISGHSLFIGSQDSEPEKIILQLPAPVIGSQNQEEENLSSKDPMLIAWRYQNIKAQSNQPETSQNFGHFFDLSKNLPQSVIETANITTWSGKIGVNDLFEESHYASLLKSLIDHLEKYSAQTTSTDKNILRIALMRVGSPLWSGSRFLFKFLYYLRSLVRTSFSTCLITVPAHLFEDKSFIKKCLHLSDVCLRLESFTGTNLEKNFALKDYHGFLHISKLAAINSILSFVPKTSDLVFKLRKKKFVIEKLHLPPEFEDSTEREQDDLASVNCASSGLNRLNF